MTGPNIQMIASSLRNCSLRERRAPPSLPPVAAPPLHLDSELTVNLNSEIAVPYPWEQCLDMRSGEIYYINWKDGTRTTQDPRVSTTSGYSSNGDDEDSSSDDTSDDDGDTTSYSSGVTSVDSTYSTRGGGDTLVAAGCKSCFMYFMVPKCVEDCPKCGGDLLHLGRNGCC